ncbi:MAG: hypothetical protein V2J12_00940 [Gammaproteobacteria bacterium]|jgi:hypothetical protein|nr:hypothetical protein [Gammaproteobacteria bacterium]
MRLTLVTLLLTLGAAAGAAASDLSHGFPDDPGFDAPADADPDAAPAAAGGFADDWGDEWDDGGAASSGWLPVSGFIEGALGSRWNEDAGVGRRATLADLRVRLESGWENDTFSVTVKGDLLTDFIDQQLVADLRDVSVAFSPRDRLDVKAGRQVLTWGTGDLLFLNDLFPKDFVSFFAGRDDEFLKAPSTSLRVTQYTDVVNVDFAWTPKFKPDNFITGERFSYFSPFVGAIIGDTPPLAVDRPDSGLQDGEYALRLFRNVRGVEYAVYGYYGFFKTPSQVNAPFDLTFAPMASVGASVRRPLGPGLFNAETVYYDSRDDRDGTDPAIVNSQVRLLLGYEWEAVRNFNVGLQYYLEHVRDYGALRANSPFPEFEPPQNRHVLTNRLTYRTLQDKLTWSLFTFWSPSDHDLYLRPVLNYRGSDAWNIAAGLNLIGGRDPFTFFGQFEDNSNAYFRVRYNY